MDVDLIPRTTTSPYSLEVISPPRHCRGQARQRTRAPPASSGPTGRPYPRCSPGRTGLASRGGHPASGGSGTGRGQRGPAPPLLWKNQPAPRPRGHGWRVWIRPSGCPTLPVHRPLTPAGGVQCNCVTERLRARQEFENCEVRLTVAMSWLSTHLAFEYER